jgi:Ca2+/H+ antiporter
MNEEPKLADPASGTRYHTDVVQDAHTNDVTEKAQSIEEALQDPKTAEDDHEYPSAWSLTAIMIALYLAIFLVALVSGSRSP